jgi:hypothetical protein
MEGTMKLPVRTSAIAVLLGGTAAIFAILTLLAGLPPAERIPAFAFGIGVLIAFTLGIGWIGWHLLLRPMPTSLAGVSEPIAIRPATRNIIALFLTLSTLSVGVAGVWDEIWHSKYGIPFGEDFFWRPHLMLYFSFGTLIVVGGWSWVTMMNRGRGTVQQRFRANPLLGVSFLAGLFTIYAVGADPIWHRLYGSDIAPWSLPHLLILIMILVMGSLALAFHKTLMPQRQWALTPRLGWRDLMMIIVVVGALVDYLLIFTIQWYAARTGSTRQLAQVLNYPDWLFAVFITFLAVLFGALALHSTRRIGSATLVGLLAFGVRFLLDRGFAGVRDGTPPLLLIIPLLLTMDIVYAVALRRTGKPPAIWWTVGSVAVVFGVVGYPIIAGLFPFLPTNILQIPARIIASAITGVGTLLLAQFLTDLSGYGQPQEVSSEAPAQSRWAGASLYAAFAVFLVLFIVTATPPR